MWVEVDEDLLPRLWGSYDPHALLGGRVRAGIPRGGQVLRDVDLYVSSAFICSTETHFDLTSTLRQFYPTFCAAGLEESVRKDANRKSTPVDSSLMDLLQSPQTQTPNPQPPAPPRFIQIYCMETKTKVNKKRKRVLSTSPLLPLLHCTANSRYLN